MTPDRSTSRSSPARATAGRPPLFIGGLAVALLLVAGASAASDGGADNAVRFAPGWEDHTRPLLFHGVRAQGGTWWLVPSTLPKGTYRVITRTDGQPRLVDGQRFTVTSDVFREVNLAISSADPSPEAIDERWVVIPGETPAAR